MKTLLIALSVLTTLQTLAADVQPTLPKSADGRRYEYSAVVQVDNAAADELYSRAKAWVAKTYASAPDVIKLDDPSGGQLIAKGTFQIPFFMTTAWARHSWTIEVKDGRYRYTLTEFRFVNESTDIPFDDPPPPYHLNKKTIERTAARSEELIESLRLAMLTPSPAAATSW